ncbi:MULTISPECIES: condensation domain-containing protein [Paenibacillus]|uniref:condensation domain-containing protein n=1 Tax=Paenibacillus TaxID=44249 RepID=UPI00031A3501|nr:MULTISPECIES: condensation domain-containing protein [Paenibacillus]KKD53592.1 hypothetical protein C400_16990 [Paenibacillus sp. ICGEB2008]MBE3648612.1 hypothetical protein [Paenibacillus polymyxa]MEE4576438.1 condensation domain-containing protein [Paenibacillus polymyxa]UQQ34214.1 condensation domain-containing protein [Paenibacillus polymyxa]SPY16672.1 polyketide synthase module containing protein [Paenibacillus polymyxa]
MQSSENLHEKQNDIAIIGISGLFASDSTIDQLWNRQKEGKAFVKNLSEIRQHDTNSYLNWITGEGANKAISFARHAFLDSIDCFDYPFFSISFEEACLIDPSLRLLLQVVWHTLEDAGYGGNTLYGTRTGVFYGESDLPEYSYAQMVADVNSVLGGPCATENLSSLIPSRISYLMDWHGPTVVTNAADASSLVAVHQACQSLRAGECEQALIGTSRINLFPIHSYGTEVDDGEGVMAILIKPLNKAILDGDHIHAVIKGSSTNHHGRVRDSGTYKDLLVQAWKNASIDPSTISFIETHSNKDNLEYVREREGIKSAFSHLMRTQEQLLLGSIKSSIGQLKHASGLAGLLQAVMALEYEELPSAVYNKLEKTNVSPGGPSAWHSDIINLSAEVLRCGVNSFGRGGANCHVILEKFPKESTEEKTQGWEMLTLSAQSVSSLLELMNSYKEWMIQSEGYRLGDLCYTANAGRKHFRYRSAIITSNREDLLNKLTVLSTTNLELSEISGVYYSELENHEPVIEKVMETCMKKYETREKALNELGQLYVQGVEFDWNEIYKECDYKKISLPVYPFAKLRCWIDPSVRILNNIENETENREILILELFKKYLGFSHIKLEDNFYELGGDSITAIKIVNELNAILHTDLKDVDVLKNPSVAQLTELLRKTEGMTSVSVNTIIRQPPKPFYPLSSDQSRIFVMIQYNPDFTMYNKPVALVVDGNLDFNRLQTSIDRIVRRHEALRTSFDVIDGEPIQIIHDDARIKMEMYPSILKEDELELMMEKFTRPFNWRTAPLARGALVQLTNGKQALVFDFHHLISDGTSLLIFFKELIHFYKLDQELEPLTVQFRDYVVWQNERKHSSEQEQKQQFWVSKCAAPIPKLNLPTDFERPAYKTYQGSQICLRMNSELAESVYRFAKETESTIYVVLLAVYHLLLEKQTGQNDIIIGSVSQGRPHREVDPVMGMFVHTIIMRNCSSTQNTFHEFINQVRINTLQCFEHQDYPFEDLVAILQLDRDRSRNPLFDVAFILHNMYTSLKSPEFYEMYNYPFHNGVSLVDLALEVHETEEGISCNWEYSTSLFQQETVKVLAEDFMAILAQLMHQPDIPLGSHSCLHKNVNIVEDVKFLF